MRGGTESTVAAVSAAGAASLTPLVLHLRPGARVAVTFLPGSDIKTTVATVKRLHAEGVPHGAGQHLEAGDVHLREREQQHEKTHQEGHEVREGHDPRRQPGPLLSFRKVKHLAPSPR